MQKFIRFLNRVGAFTLICLGFCVLIGSFIGVVLGASYALSWIASAVFTSEGAMKAAEFTLGAIFIWWFLGKPIWDLTDILIKDKTNAE